MLIVFDEPAVAVRREMNGAGGRGSVPIGYARQLGKDLHIVFDVARRLGLKELPVIDAADHPYAGFASCEPSVGSAAISRFHANEAKRGEEGFK